MLDRGLIYCAPQDCPEIFALDATTGDLVWSTDAVQVPDAIHLLGVYGQNLIVSGDRIAWLDRLSGKVQARFPGSATAGTLNALPAPRGMGRGAISGEKVLWPVSGEVLVFDANLQPSQPPPQKPKALGTSLPALRDRIHFGARGSEGGNIVVADRCLLYVSPSRIMAFRPDANQDKLSSLP